MDTLAMILRILDEVLNLGGAALAFDSETRLRGALPQLDSMAVVSLITEIENSFGISFPEEELDGALFETVGTLVECVDSLVQSHRR
jgi:acyl carrier protein